MKDTTVEQGGTVVKVQKQFAPKTTRSPTVTSPRIVDEDPKTTLPVKVGIEQAVEGEPGRNLPNVTP